MSTSVVLLLFISLKCIDFYTTKSYNYEREYRSSWNYLNN